MKKRKKMAKAYRSLKKSGVSANEGREGIYASKASAEENRITDNDLGLTLLPGSQMNEDAVNEKAVIDPVIAFQDNGQLECSELRRSNRLARRGESNLATCFTSIIQDRVSTHNQPPIIRTLLYDRAESSSNTNSTSSTSISSPSPSTCTSPTIKLCSYNYNLALQLLSKLSSQLAISRKVSLHPSKALGVARMDFTSSEDPPNDPDGAGGFFDQWSADPGILYDKMDFESLFASRPVTPEKLQSTEAYANIDNHQIASTLTDSNHQHFKDSDKATTPENTASSIEANELMETSTTSENLYSMDTSSTSVTPAAFDTPTSLTTPATVYTPGTPDTPATSDTEYIVLEHSNTTMTQGLAHPTIHANESMESLPKFRTQAANAITPDSFHHNTAVGDTDNTLSTGHMDPIHQSNEQTKNATNFSDQYTIATPANTYNQYSAFGDSNSNKNNGHENYTVQTNEPRQAPNIFGNQYGIGNSANSYNPYTTVVGSNYTTSHGDTAFAYPADGRMINQVSAVPSESLTLYHNRGFADQSVAEKVHTNNPDLLLKLVRKQHTMMDVYMAEIEKHKVANQHYRDASERYKAADEQHITEIQQFKAEYQYLRAQNVGLDNQILEHNKMSDNYRAQCAKIIETLKIQSNANRATPAQDEVANLNNKLDYARQVAEQATANAKKITDQAIAKAKQAKDEIRYLKAENQKLKTATEQLNVAQDIISRLTKDRNNWKSMAEGWSRIIESQPQVPSPSVKQVLAAYAPTTTTVTLNAAHIEQRQLHYAQNVQPGQSQQAQFNRAQHTQPGHAQIQKNHAQQVQSNHTQHIQPGQALIQPNHAQYVQFNHTQHMQDIQAQLTRPTHAQYIQLNHVQNVQPSSSQNIQPNHFQSVQSSHTQRIEIDLTQDFQPDHTQYVQSQHAQHAQPNQPQQIEPDHAMSDHVQHVQHIYTQPAATACSDKAREKPKGWWLDPKAHGIVEDSHPILRKIDEKRAAVSVKIQERARKAKGTDKVARAAHKAAARQRMKESKTRAAMEAQEEFPLEVQRKDHQEIEEVQEEFQEDGAESEDGFGDALDYAFAEIDASDAIAELDASAAIAEVDAGNESTREWTDEDGMRLVVALQADLANDEAKNAAARAAADETAATESAAAEAAAAEAAEEDHDDHDDHDSLFDE
ncbi:hypothetical protein MMC26_003236 [Xylographa opegraphella]|nr:hypothetical protein [Xylographa opegraphella]